MFAKITYKYAIDKLINSTCYNNDIISKFHDTLELIF